jgi:cbb3-type cytochrome oxidase maturation protein
MDILFLLIPLSVVLAFCIGWFFWRAVDTGQFDDLDTPGLAILADDDKPRPADASPPTPQPKVPESTGV